MVQIWLIVVKGLLSIIRSLILLIKALQYKIRIQRCQQERLLSILRKVRNCLEIKVQIVSLLLILLEPLFKGLQVLLEGYSRYICAAFKGMRLISKLGLLKSFIKGRIYLAISFSTLAMLEISRKKSALVVFCVLYTYYIFSILGVLLFKLS